jgi:hypothetical protein
MRAFQKILFPVDTSDSCTATAPFVEAMAKKYNADVTMLHVLEMPSGMRFRIGTGHYSDRRCRSDFD